MYKLASLFDGSGGFPLAGTLCGIRPVWASEVEPYPIAVTRERFPGMAHMGDISKINGAEVEPVDIITFGSPCQDLSAAGKRAGLKHTDNGDEETTRSGLFMEAVRIIKEMRAATNGKYPRFALWENVPGAFSSNKGEDFRTVLEELIRIVEPDAVMPPVPSGGWAYADSYSGDGWSLAYRVFDAQYWGVPQRRRRIHLVVDFTGQCAEQVLFERRGVRGYFAEGRTPWQGAAGGAAESTGTTGAGRYCINTQGQSGVSVTVDHAGTLVAQDHDNHPAVLEAAGFCTEPSAKARSIGYEEEVSPTLRAGVVPAALLFENHSADTRCRGPLDISPALSATLGTGGNNQPFVVHPPKAYGICAKHSNSMQSDNPHSGFYEANTARTIDTSDQSPVKNQGSMCVVAPETYDVRFTSSGTKNARGHCYKTEICRCLDTGGQDPESNHGEIAVVNDTTETYALQGSMISRSEKNGPQGSGVNKDVCFTLNTADRHCIATPEGNHYSTSKTSHHTVAAHEQANTLVASDWKDPPLVNDNPNDEPVYIIRRLTPTECARLQGFPDAWGHIPERDSLTDEECTFWQDVRDTYAGINGKPQKDYTATQLLTWYNKLHTDSAEYKMWGNGIALPPALYCMQGIVDALDASTGDEDWIN